MEFYVIFVSLICSLNFFFQREVIQLYVGQAGVQVNVLHKNCEWKGNRKKIDDSKSWHSCFCIKYLPHTHTKTNKRLDPFFHFPYAATTTKQLLFSISFFHPMFALNFIWQTTKTFYCFHLLLLFMRFHFDSHSSYGTITNTKKS